MQLIKKHTTIDAQRHIISQTFRQPEDIEDIERRTQENKMTFSYRNAL